MGTNEYSKRYTNLMFRLWRAQQHWVEPLFANESFEGARQLALSRDGDMVFEAQPSKVGSSSIYRHKDGGGFLKWSKGEWGKEEWGKEEWGKEEGKDSTWVVFGTAALMHSVLVDSKLIGIFSNYAAQGDRRSKRFLTLDMESGEWRAMSIPPLSVAKAIPVTLK